MYHLLIVTALASIAMLFAGMLIVFFEFKMFADIIKNHQLSYLQKVVWCSASLVLLPVTALLYYFTAHPHTPHHV